jgi:hypothetical protein
LNNEYGDDIMGICFFNAIENGVLTNDGDIKPTT